MVELGLLDFINVSEKAECQVQIFTRRPAHFVWVVGVKVLHYFQQNASCFCGNGEPYKAAHDQVMLRRRGNGLHEEKLFQLFTGQCFAVKKTLCELAAVDFEKGFLVA